MDHDLGFAPVRGRFPTLSARRAATRYGVPMNRPLEGRIILIAEDEPLIALQMTLALEDEGRICH